jgi:hypothetical protein
LVKDNKSVDTMSRVAQPENVGIELNVDFVLQRDERLDENVAH